MTYCLQNMLFYKHYLNRFHIYRRQCHAKSITLIIEIPVKVCRYGFCQTFDSIPLYFVDSFNLSIFLLCYLLTLLIFLLSRPFYTIDLLTQSTSVLCRPFYQSIFLLLWPFYSVELFTLSTFLLCPPFTLSTSVLFRPIYLVNLFTLSTFYSVEHFTLSTFLLCQSFHSIELFTMSTFSLCRPLYIPCQSFYTVHLSLVTGSGQVRTTRTLLEETRSPVHLYIAVTDGLISVQTLLSVDILSRGNFWCFNTLSLIAALFFFKFDSILKTTFGLYKLKS